METQISKTGNSTYLLIWGVGIAIIVFGTGGVVAILGWVPALMIHGSGIVGVVVARRLLGNQIGGRRGDNIATVIGNTGDMAVTKATEESVNEDKNYIITILLENGLSSVIHEANPSEWRSGVRVKFVNGSALSRIGKRLLLKKCSAVMLAPPVVISPDQAVQSCLKNSKVSVSAKRVGTQQYEQALTLTK